MTVAFDAVSLGNGTGDISWTHTPVGTPRGALVLIAQNAGATNEITSVTYGGVAMTAVSGSPALHATGESGAAYAYFLGAGIPAGAQTVLVDVPSAGSAKRAIAITLTATTDTEVVDADATIASDSLADPSVTLQLNGRASFAALAFQSGQNAPGSTTPLSNWTDRGEFDFGTQVSGLYTYDTIASTDVTAGWTQTAEDAVMIAVAVSEVQVLPPPSKLAAALAMLLLPWQVMQPAQPVRVDIASTIATVVTADAPPPRDGRNLARIIGQWWKPVRHGTGGNAAPAVDEVPPARPRLEQILAQWTPAAPMPPRPRVFTPGYVPDQPPPATRAAITAITQASWIPPPSLPPRAPLLVPITPAAQVDAPPPMSRAVVSTITQAAWAPTPGLPPRASELVQPSAAAAVNDPPFDARRAALGPIYSAWKWRAVGSGDAGPTPQADPVPPATRHPEILASWTPTVALPQRPRTVATLPGVSVDAPPATGTAGTMATIQTAWLPSPPAPQRKVSLSPGIPGQSVDQPPPQPRQSPPAAWQPSPGLPQRAPHLVPIAAAANDPPFARKHELRPTLSAWQPAPEQVVYVSRLVFEYTPDDPPPSVFAGRLATLLRAWLPDPPAAQWGRHVPPADAVVPTVNDPPFDSRRSALGPIYSSWKWRPVGSGDAAAATPSVVNDPPFGQRPWLPTALAAWQPGPPRSQAGAHVPVSVSAVPVNDPPPLTRQPLAILSAWQPLPALPPARPDVIQDAAAPAVDNPPPSARPLSAILSAWQPPPRPSQRTPQTPQVAAAVADVPPTTRPWLGPILAGWQATTLPLPPRPWLAPIPGASVDAPPIQRPPSLALIRAAWDPPAPLPTLPAHLAQERPPDPPPFGLRSWLPTALSSWQPGPPAPQWGRHVPVSVSAVPVNDPPFGIRPWLPTVRALWIPGPPQPITRPIVATESGPSTQIPLLVVTAIRIQRAHAGWIWVTPARATTPRIVKAHATGMSVASAMATAPRIQRAHATNVRIFGG